MKLEIYEQIVSILKGIIKDTKFENHTYTVGGCERDRILGNEIKDIDIVVDLILVGALNLLNIFMKMRFRFIHLLYMKTLVL